MHSPALTLNSHGHQGDVRFRLVPRASMPESARPAAVAEGNYIVTHSETGHHHLVDATQAVLYETADPFVAYLQLADDVEAAVVRHHKTGEHVHGPVTLLRPPSSDWVWRISRQREWTPEEVRRAAD